MHLVTYIQEYVQNCTDIEKAIGVDPANITNRVPIFLFIKNLYNRNIRKRVAGAKVVNSLADAFTLAHHSLLKLKKYKALVYSEEQEIGEINQTVGISKDIGGTDSIKQSNKSV